MAIFRLSPSGLAHFWGCTAMNETSTDPSSLSDLSDRSEGKTGLRQISWCFEANSWLFNEKMREIWPNPAFP
jgi:hypothetical protein